MADRQAYLKAAQDLKDADPRMTPTDIHRTLEAAGMSRPEGWRLEPKGKGKLGWKSIEARRSSKVREHAQRRATLNLRPPQNAQERTENRRQVNQRAALNRQFGAATHVIDHVVPLERLGQTVEGMPPDKATRTIQRLEQSYGPLGDRPGNRQVISAQDNELKRQQETALQRRLQQMEQTRPSRLASPAAQYAQQRRVEAKAAAAVQSMANPGPASQQIRTLMNSTSDVIQFHPGQGIMMPGI